MTATERRARLAGLAAPALATLVSFAVLVGLGTWQLDRKAWKEGLIAQIAARAHGEAGEAVPEARWPDWRAEADEFRRVRVSGTWMPDGIAPVIGIAEERPGRAFQGIYVFEPLRRDDGSVVIVNRGFVPTELQEPILSRLRGERSRVDLTGLVRAPEPGGWFLPSNVPETGRWFTRAIDQMAANARLDRVAPFYVDADRAGETWPRGGGTPLALRNQHLEYAVTWFGLAATLLGVFVTFAVNRMRGADSSSVHDFEPDASRTGEQRAR